MTRYRPGKTEYMFKIVSKTTNSAKILSGPYASGYYYNVDNYWQNPIKGRLIDCRRGYHVVRLRQLPKWLRHKEPQFGHRIYLIKADMKDALERPEANKVVVRNFRFMCELDSTRDVIGANLWSDRYTTYRNITSNFFLANLARKWGLSVRSGIITGEYEALSIK